MKTTILTFILALVALVGMGQSKTKWVEGGGWDCIGCPKSDTVTKSYYLYGRDSISVEMKKEDCNCKFYIDRFDHVKRNCQGLKRYYLMRKYWNLFKEITIIKGKIIKTTTPHWDSNMGQMSMVDGVYMKKGKEVYPESIFIYNKLMTLNK